MMDVIAETHLRATDRGGKAIALHISISRPRCEPDGSWACAISMAGLYDNLADVRGVDSFQALCLAVGLIRQLLEDFAATGGKLE